MDLTRNDIISAFQYNRGGSSLAVTTTPGDPISDPEDQSNDEARAEGKIIGGDGEVDEMISALDNALADLERAQGTDDDANTDPDDVPIVADIKQMRQLMEKLKSDQLVDDAGEPPSPTIPSELSIAAGDLSGTYPPVTLANQPTSTDEPPATTPVDEDGNIEPSTKCANPDCEHLASVHEDVPDMGDNTGKCGTPGCGCEAMELEKIGGQIGVDDSGGGADNAGGDDTPADAGTATTASAGTIKVPVGFFAVETPVVEADEPAPTSDLNAPPVMSADDSELRPWTCPVMWVEGQETGDGRMINAEAVEWFNPPLPLMLLKTSPHGGEWDPNDPAVWCGLINSITRVAGEGGTQLGTASGYYLNTADGNDAHDIVESMGRAGISIDLQVVESEISGELDDDGWPTQTTMTVVKGMLMGATICPFPAFNQAYIVNGDGTDGGPAAIPQQSDNTPPIVASGGQLIHWMTSEECVPCADGVDVLIASAAPNRPPRSWFEDPNFAAIDDERLVEIYSVDHKGNMIERGDMACPITVTDDGQVFGHVAAWGQCHRLYTNMCVTPPSSKTGYAGFRHGWVKTAEGDDVRVGSLTAGTGHAAMNLNRVESEQHYANSGYSVADVNIGEDAYGIWIAGRVSPLATDDQIEALRTGGQSGDWRNGEMIASLTVNVPGFPMAIVPSKLAPRQWSKGSQTTLIAAGAAPLFRVKYNKALAASAGQPVEFIDHAAREAIKPLLPIIRANLARKINLGI